MESINQKIKNKMEKTEREIAKIEGNRGGGKTPPEIYAGYSEDKMSSLEP